MIDGYDHVLSFPSFVSLVSALTFFFAVQVTGLWASTNNQASTVLNLFLDSIHEHGCPSRVRGDRGGENVAVAVWMIMHKGPGGGSFMWGS
jgi:hypothetical protein